MRFLITLLFVIAVCYMGSAQNLKDTASKNQSKTYSYAYVTVEGKGFGKKLKVDVDFGDTPEQVASGKEYSEILTSKKSYAAILNYMAESEYELVESRDNNFSYQGIGGTYNVIFIMRRKR